MATSAKAVAIARELADKWTKQVATTLPVLVQTVDANGNPVITLSSDPTPATGEKVIVVRVSPMTWTSTTVIGTTTSQPCPTIVELCTEANYASTNDNIADILTPVELLPVLAECVKTGCMVKWYVITNGTVPSTSVMTSTYLVASYQDLYWSALKSQ
jgi:hypothetical protein